MFIQFIIIVSLPTRNRYFVYFQKKKIEIKCRMSFLSVEIGEKALVKNQLDPFHEKLGSILTNFFLYNFPNSYLLIYIHIIYMYNILHSENKHI